MAEFQRPRGGEYLRFLKETPNNGIIYLRGFLNSEQLLLTHPTALAEVLGRNTYDYKRPDGERKFFHRVLGNGIVVTEGDEHKTLRKQIAPSFNFKPNDLYPLLWEKSVLLTRVLMEQLETSSSNSTEDPPLVSGEVDISEWSQRASLDIIGQAGFGWDFNTLRNRESEFARSFKKIFAATVGNRILFAVSIYGASWMLDYVPGGVSKRFLAACRTVRKVCEDCIREKRRLAEADVDHSPDILARLIADSDFADTTAMKQLQLLSAGPFTSLPRIPKSRLAFGTSSALVS